VTSSELFLAIIALSTLIMALVQVGAIIAILKLARQTQEAVAELQRDVKPLIAQATVVAAKATAVADEATRTATLVTAQTQKIDRLLTTFTVRFDQTAAVVQQAIITPAREGMAIVAGLKAALGALQSMRERQRQGRGAEEEDPLFIG
jgi:hypothetical protein